VPKRSSTYVDDPVSLGRRLKETRKRMGLTQSQLAFPGCSPGYISRIEAGDRVPSLQILRELARRLGVGESVLLTGGADGTPWPSPLVDAEIALRLGDLAQAHEGYENALREADSDRVRSAALEGLGHVAAQGGDLRRAVQLLERALGLAGGDAPSRPRLAEALGRAYATLGELAPALALFTRCAEYFEREGDSIQYVRFACLLGYALTDTGDFRNAERVVARALEKGREVGDVYTRARLYWSQARLLGMQGQSDLAERYARRALEALRVTEDNYALGHAHQTLAHICLDLGRAEEAADILRQGWPLIASAATPSECANYRIEEARSLAALGRKEEALELAATVIDHLRDAFPQDAGRARLLVGEIFEDGGDVPQARELYELAISTLESCGPSRYLISAYRRLACLLKADGLSEEALEVLERAVRVQEQAGHPLV
jgi:tetratricopeptide (TPR) repeat protein